VKPTALISLVRDLRREQNDHRPLVVAGARELVPLLARELREGGDPAAVREGGPPAGAAALVWVGAADEAVLREAKRLRVPIVGVTEGGSLPYVLDTDIVTVEPGRGFPVDEIATAVARVLRERGTGLAARLPVLREAIVDDLIRTSSRRNAAIAVGVFVPGVSMPVLTLNQLRLVGRIARAHGLEKDPLQSPELLGVVGAGFAWRTAARTLLDFVPVAGWAVKGGVAYTGTQAVGEAARKFFGAQSA
jgi:uncharacterized protein (DUF697 family)